jgi:hypothetical protein
VRGDIVISTTRVLELRMSPNSPRPLTVIAAFAVAVLLIGAAAQAPTLKGGFFKANNGTNVIGIDFDTTGALNVTLDGQAFSQSTWQLKADTVTFGPITGPEGYGCPAGAKYTWSIKENTVTFALVADECEVRMQSLTALVWTRG